MRRTLFLVLILAVVLLAPVAYFLHIPFFGEQQNGSYTRALAVSGDWSAHNYDLVYTVAFSSAPQPNGPLVAYRASGANLQDVVPVAVVARAYKYRFFGKARKDGQRCMQKRYYRQFCCHFKPS